MVCESDLHAALAREPGDQLAWLALADCLEENGEPDRAELVRRREWLRFADVNDPQRPGRQERQAELLIAGVRPSVPRRVIDLGDGVTLPLVLIPAGSFWMGCPDDEEGRWPEEGPRHVVRIARPFWLGQTPVTDSQWHRLTRTRSRRKRKKNDQPVVEVDWPDSQDYCARLGEQIGAVARLPTEAEWEYACRAGTCGETYLGDGIGRAALAGWYIDNAERALHPVAAKVPNAWGLYDMLGNVWNWCLDGQREYSKRKRTDPRGPDGNRAIKGASWKSMGFRVRGAVRYPYQEHYRFNDLGFRVLVEYR